MSRGRDDWLARRTAAARVVPRAAAHGAVAVRRLWGGWTVTVTGEGLLPLGGPGRVEIGGTALEDVRFSGREVTGRLRRMPASHEATIDLGFAQLGAVPVRLARPAGLRRLLGR